MLRRNHASPTKRGGHLSFQRFFGRRPSRGSVVKTKSTRGAATRRQATETRDDESSCFFGTTTRQTPKPPAKETSILQYIHDSLVSCIPDKYFDQEDERSAVPSQVFVPVQQSKQKHSILRNKQMTRTLSLKSSAGATNSIVVDRSKAKDDVVGRPTSSGNRPTIGTSVTNVASKEHAAETSIEKPARFMCSTGTSFRRSRTDNDIVAAKPSGENDGKHESHGGLLCSIEDSDEERGIETIFHSHFVELTYLAMARNEETTMQESDPKEGALRSKAALGTQKGEAPIEPLNKSKGLARSRPLPLAVSSKEPLYLI